MAISLSTTLSRFSVSSSSSSVKARVFTAPAAFSPRPLPRLTRSRKFNKIQATILQENGEKVVVEETFQPKTFPDDLEKESHSESTEGSTSSAMEGWVIKLENSINIFLTGVGSFNV